MKCKGTFGPYYNVKVLRPVDTCADKGAKLKLLVKMRMYNKICFLS